VSFDDPHADYFRRLMGLIYHCDLFVGCDSVGQHIARASNKPGIILMGGTDERNYSYPNHFTIVRKEDRTPVYSPWRLSDIDVEFADRANDDIMNFDEEEFSSILELVNSHLNGSSASQNPTQTNVNPTPSSGLSYE
jgi:hypothetical protein